MVDPVLAPEALRLARQRAGIKPGAFADKVGISRGYLWLIESGKRTPAPELFYRFASVLEVPPETLAAVAA